MKYSNSQLLVKIKTSLTKIHLLKALLGSSRTCKMPKCRSLADP